MAKTLSLGLDPKALELHLTRGADFYTILRYVVGGVPTNWPGSTVLTLVFDDPAVTDWTASISTSDATFDVDKAVTDQVVNLTGVRLRYVNGSTDRIWFVGKVIVHG